VLEVQGIVWILKFLGLGLFCAQRWDFSRVDWPLRRKDTKKTATERAGSGHEGTNESGDFGRFRVMMIEASIDNDSVYDFNVLYVYCTILGVQCQVNSRFSDRY